MSEGKTKKSEFIRSNQLCAAVLDFINVQQQMKTVDCRYCYNEAFKIAHARKTCLCLKLDIVKILNFF